MKTQQVLPVRRYAGRYLAAALVSLAVTGCAMQPSRTDIASGITQAREYLKNALLTSENPVVRAQAIEAIQDAPWPEAMRYVQSALADPHRGVRFAACMALGHTRYAAAKPMLEAALKDPSDSVRAAAIYALHRLGDTRYTTQLAELLLRNPSEEVRRNAAFILGELGEPGATIVLRRALRDKDVAVRWHALEAMARLGDKNAIDQLMLFAHSGYGDERLIGILALGRVRDRKVIPALQDMLKRDNPLEVKLAAIRALGQHGIRTGQQIARRALRWRPPRTRASQVTLPEPEDVRITRIRSMAALALGEVGGPEDIPPLLQRMRSDDPRVGVAAARAILRITARENLTAGGLAPPGF